jgi:flagellar FliL protein
MAESNPETPEIPEIPAIPEQGSRRASFLTKLMVLGFIVTVVVAECLATYWLVPMASQGEALAAPPPPQAAAKGKSSSKEKEKGKEDKKAKEEPADQTEVDLGEFTVTAFQPSSNNTLRIALHLFGTVAPGDEVEFVTRMKENLHRFRESVIVTLRGAEVNDLTDAGLGLLKRTILEKTNAILGKPLLKLVVFSDFSFVQM